MNTTTRQYATAWYELLAEADVRERKKISMSVLQSLHKRGALSGLSETVRAMEDIEAARTGTVHITVTAARDVDSTTIKKLVATLVGDKSPRIIHKKDENVLGGVRIETKNKRWDFSVRGQLSQLKKRLT